MVTRETYPTEYRDCAINVVAEQMADGGWAAVATVARYTGDAQEITPVPIQDRRFDSMEGARDYALAAGRDWIDRNSAGT